MLRRLALAALTLTAGARARQVLAGTAGAALVNATASFHGNAAYNGDPYALNDGSCACWKARTYGVCSAAQCFHQVQWPYLTGALSTPGMNNTAECGTCYRVTCVPGRLRGRADSELGPWEGCLRPGAAVTVVVTDSCPCGHWNPSNRRWCCGGAERPHIDLSYWAFERIGRLEQGVIDVTLERVPCDAYEWTGASLDACRTR
jgi:hypothetical protein